MAEKRITAKQNMVIWILMWSGLASVFIAPFASIEGYNDVAIAAVVSAYGCVIAAFILIGVWTHVPAVPDDPPVDER